jgi:hypothetical protein
MKISVFLTVCCVMTAASSTRVRAQTAYPEITPADVSLHPRVGEEARVAPPSKAITKRGSLSLWSLEPAKEPADALFRLGKTNFPASATPKTGLTSDPSLPSGPKGFPYTHSSGESSSGASATVHALNGFSQNQTRQRFPKSPLLKDAFGLVTLRSKVHGLGSNLELNRTEFWPISSSRKSLGASSAQPTLKPLKPQQKRSSSGVESGTRQTAPPSAKRPIN